MAASPAGTQVGVDIARRAPAVAAGPGAPSADDLLVAGFMEEVGPAIDSIVGYPHPAGTSPLAQPDSQRAPVQKASLRKSDTAAVMGTSPSPAPAYQEGMLGRIRRRRVGQMSKALQEMFRSTLAYDRSVLAYNDLARTRAPALFAQVARMARESGLSENQVLDKVRDLRIADPALGSLRSGMARLAQDPSLAQQQAEMAELARCFQERSGKVQSFLAYAASGRGDPQSVAHGAATLRAAVDRELTPRVAALATADVAPPGAAPSPMRAAFSAGVDQMAGKIEALLDQLAVSPGPVPRRA